MDFTVHGAPTRGWYTTWRHLHVTALRAHEFKAAAFALQLAAASKPLQPATAATSGFPTPPCFRKRQLLWCGLPLLHFHEACLHRAPMLIELVISCSITHCLRKRTCTAARAFPSETCAIQAGQRRFEQHASVLPAPSAAGLQLPGEAPAARSVEGRLAVHSSPGIPEVLPFLVRLGPLQHEALLHHQCAPHAAATPQAPRTAPPPLCRRSRRCVVHPQLPAHGSNETSSAARHCQPRHTPT
eukprot:82252-Chlamydomonas_euryale.AAC.7